MTPDQFKTKCREYNVISPQPLLRISEKVQHAKSQDGHIYDVHVHTFHKDCINEFYFLLKMLGERTRGIQSLHDGDVAPFTPRKTEEIDYAVEEFRNTYHYYTEEDIYENPPTDITWKDIEDTFEKAHSRAPLIEHIDSGREAAYYVFSRFLRKNSQEEILKDFFKNFAVTNINGFKGKSLITCALMMDFYNEFKGPVKRSLSKQIEDYNTLARAYPVLPFLAIDPRRMDEDEDSEEHLFNLFLKAFDRKKAGLFFGVKFYPALGYSPSDYRLEPIYEICQEFQIPIVTHCGGEIVSTFSKDIWVYEDFKQEKSVVPGDTRKDRVFYLNDPKRWESVLRKYPNLKINFAHFGNDEAFFDENIHSSRDYLARKRTILNLMKCYSGVFADFSYAFTSPHVYGSFMKTLNENTSGVQDRILFGTDFWVALFAKGERFVTHQTAFIQLFESNPNLRDKIFRTNAERYLFEIVEDNPASPCK